MHVVQLVPSLAIGGMETMVVHLATWLHAKSVSVEVLFFERGDALVGELTSRGVPVRRLCLAPYVWRFYPKELIRHLAGRKDVVLHGHLYAWYKGIAAARWREAACVYTHHGAEEEWIWKQWRAMRRSARATDVAVAVSQETLAFLVERLGIPAGRAYHLPNGVPDIRDRHEPDGSWEAPIRKDGPVIGMVARLARPKDPDTLIEAALLVQAEFPGVQLVLIGGGPDENRLRERIRALGAEGFIHLLGERRDVPRLLPRLDVFVLSSRSEGHSIATLEAMSAERAIVATGVGGSAQLLDEGKCGLLVPPGEPRPMAQAILRLLRDSAERSRLGALARRRFLEHFSLDRMGESYLAIYREALERRTSGRASTP